ncbi:MAG: hypothetical protein AAFV43_01375 [Planctomycetota bacterium]
MTISIPAAPFSTDPFSTVPVGPVGTPLPTHDTGPEILPGGWAPAEGGEAPTVGDGAQQAEPEQVKPEQEEAEQEQPAPATLGEHDRPPAGAEASSDPFDDFDDDDFDDEFDDDFEEDWDDEEEDDGFGPEFQDSEGEEFDVNAEATDEELEDEEEEADEKGGTKSKFAGDDDFDA